MTRTVTPAVAGVIPSQARRTGVVKREYRYALSVLEPLVDLLGGVVIYVEHDGPPRWCIIVPCSQTGRFQSRRLDIPLLTPPAESQTMLADFVTKLNSEGWQVGRQN